MSKILVGLAIPGVLGGISLAYGADTPRVDRFSHHNAYLVEVGVRFDEAAVRAALPKGLDPVEGFSGGIAIYSGEEGWALSSLSAGYVWIDVKHEANARYLVRGFTSVDLDEALGLPMDQLTDSESGTTKDIGNFRAVINSAEAGLLELVVKSEPNGCTDGLTARHGGFVFVSGRNGSLGTMHNPLVLDWCDTEAVSAALIAPPNHALGALAPERILWAGFATPLRWAMPQFLTEQEQHPSEPSFR